MLVNFVVGTMLEVLLPLPLLFPLWLLVLEAVTVTVSVIVFVCGTQAAVVVGFHGIIVTVLYVVGLTYTVEVVYTEAVSQVV